MLIISYDIESDKLRGRFMRMLTKNGAIRLQYSVYEVNNTNRVIENIKTKIEGYFKPLFTQDDSVIIMNVDDKTMQKYGNAIHRDKDVVFL